MRHLHRSQQRRQRRWMLRKPLVIPRGMDHSPRHPTNRLGRPTRSLAAHNPRAERCRFALLDRRAAAAARKLTAGPCPSITSPVGASRFWRIRGLLGRGRAGPASVFARVSARSAPRAAHCPQATARVRRLGRRGMTASVVEAMMASGRPRDRVRAKAEATLTTTTLTFTRRPAGPTWRFATPSGGPIG